MLIQKCNKSSLELKWIKLLVRWSVVSCDCLTGDMCEQSQMEHRHRKKDTPAPASTHHLFVHMKSLMSSNLGEELDVFFYIYDSRENRPLRWAASTSQHRGAVRSLWDGFIFKPFFSRDYFWLWVLWFCVAFAVPLPTNLVRIRSLTV